jgi:hypothetical protein
VVIMDDFKGMTDREILIAVALRQESLSKEFTKFTDIQVTCNRDIEIRMRNIELNGSKVSQDVAIAVAVVGKRLDDAETFIEKHKGEDSRSTSSWQEWGIIAAIIAAAAAVAAVVWRS